MAEIVRRVGERGGTRERGREQAARHERGGEHEQARPGEPERRFQVSPDCGQRAERRANRRDRLAAVEPESARKVDPRGGQIRREIHRGARALERARRLIARGQCARRSVETPRAQLERGPPRPRHPLVEPRSRREPGLLDQRDAVLHGDFRRDGQQLHRCVRGGHLRQRHLGGSRDLGGSRLRRGLGRCREREQERCQADPSRAREAVGPLQAASPL